MGMFAIAASAKRQTNGIFALSLLLFCAHEFLFVKGNLFFFGSKNISMLLMLILLLSYGMMLMLIKLYEIGAEMKMSNGDELNLSVFFAHFSHSASK